MKARSFRSGLSGFLFFLPGVLLAQAPQRSRTTALPSGTQIKVRTVDGLDTTDARAGQAFTATVAEPVVVNGRTVLARDEIVTGTVTNAISSGRLRKPASITLVLHRPATQALQLDGKSHLVRNAELIGGGTAAGALLGALAGGGKGAVIGAVVGAAAGTAGAYMTGKKEIVIPPETELVFVTGSANSYSTAGSYGQSAQEAQPQIASTSRGSEGPGSGRYANGEERRREHGEGEDGEDREREWEPGEERRGGVLPAFSSRDQQIIREYYAESYSNLPPGLAKRGGNLPPGLERQVERNGTLPPGLQKRVRPFPPEVERRLPPLPSGCSRVLLGARALIIDRNNRILDLIALPQ